MGVDLQRLGWWAGLTTDVIDVAITPYFRNWVRWGYAIASAWRRPA